MKKSKPQVGYRSLAEVAEQKALIRVAIELQQQELVSRYKTQLFSPSLGTLTRSGQLGYLLPLVEGVWFGLKVHRIARNISRGLKKMFAHRLPE